MYEYLTKSTVGYIREPRKSIAVGNDLNTLMKNTQGYAEKILQVCNSNFLEIGKWDVQTNGSYAEIIFRDACDEYGDKIRFIISEVDFVI